MYNVVLISGAKQVTDAFNSIDLWEGQDFSLVLVTNDIEEAFSAHPHVIICPAKSSFLDGAEVSRRVYDAGGKEKIILYGRKTYEYAKLAINARAWGYIGMPLERADFIQLLLNLKQYLDREDRKDSQGIRKEDLPILREDFLFGLLTGKLQDEELIIKAYHDLEMDGEPQDIKSKLVKITIDNFHEYLENKWKYGKDSLYTAVNNFITKTDDMIYMIPVYRNQNEIYVMILGFLSGSEEHYLAAVQKSIREIMGIEISYLELQSFERLTEIPKLAREQSLLPVRIDNGDQLADDEPQDEKTVISNAKEYINNCFNKEICLDDVAKFVCLSSAYFSRLFKQETGENFIDYLVKVRMENGKKLLQSTNFKTYEISQQVGYKKSKYFSKLFKNYTGYTPTEYRVRNNRKKQAERLRSMSK